MKLGSSPFPEAAVMRKIGSPLRHWRIAVLATHPIQYLAPLFKRISEDVECDIKVFYQSRISIRGGIDQKFKQSVRWDIPLLEGYDSEFLPAVGQDDVLTAWKPINFGLAKRLRNGQFDALLVYGYNRPYHWFAFLQAWALKIPVLIQDDPHLGSKRRTALKIIAKSWFFRLLVRLGCRFLAVGIANRKYYLAHGVPEGCVLSMTWAVDNDFFRKYSALASDQREAFAAQIGLEPGRPVVLFAGKLIYRKGLPTLLQAFKTVYQKLDLKPYLVLVGNGELRPQAEAAARECDDIKLVGFRNQTELPAYYALCDVLVLPSEEQETWGLVVNEAMNAGKPVIVSDRVGCASDLVKIGTTGWIFEAANVRSLAECLEEACRDLSKLAAMGENSLRLISQYSYENNVAELKRALAVGSTESDA